MTQYNSLASALQSRITKRASMISSAEQWKQVHRTLEQMTDWRASKSLIKELTKEQCLDKRILKQMREMGRLEEQLSQAALVIDDLLRAE